MRALVRYINGDSSAASSPSQGEAEVPAPTTDGRAAASSNVVDLPPIPSADHTLRRSGPPRYDGIPTANLPTHQQINCMTCNQQLRHSQRQVVCHVCTSYVHEGCTETLSIGTRYKADMCLVCQQGIQRQIRCISVVERERGPRWDQDEWFNTFLGCVEANIGYGVSSNCDLNDLEMKLANAIRRGLHYDRTSDSSTSSGTPTPVAKPKAPSPSGNICTDAVREPTGTPTPVAVPKASCPEEVPNTIHVSVPSVGSVQPQQPAPGPPQTEGTIPEPSRQCTDGREGDDGVYSQRSNLRERRMDDLEEMMRTLTGNVQRIVRTMETANSQATEIRGSSPKAPPILPKEVGADPPEVPKSKPVSQPLLSPVSQKAVPQKAFPYERPPPPVRPAQSPAFEVPEEGIWHQSYLAKSLQQVKETDFAKLKFPAQVPKPVEFEKWLRQLETTTHALHPEIGIYWKRVVAAAEEAYLRYIAEVGCSRISIVPKPIKAMTLIEERMESKLRMILASIVPQIVMRQCEDKPDVQCVLILYRTMVYAGPANKDDCAQMLDILTKPRAYEVKKLQEAMLQFSYARTRLEKYGHKEPEPRQLFDTLKMAATSLAEKDKDFGFLFQFFIMNHSSMNGKVSKESVEELFNMITEHARMYVEISPNAEKNEAKMLQQRQQRKRPQGYYQADASPPVNRCYQCGSKDHWVKDCPHLPRAAPMANNRQPYKVPPRQEYQRPPAKPSANMAPEGRPQQKVDKNGKGKGKGKKNDAKVKGAERRQPRPGARAAQDWDDPDISQTSETPCDDYTYDDYPPDDRDQDYADVCEVQGEEGYDDDQTYDGQGDQYESDQPEEDAHLYKTIMATRTQQKLEWEKELCEVLTLNANILRIKSDAIRGEDVLLDGGASHHVYYSPTIPEGAVERQVDLAHGTKTGYVKGSDITFIDKSVSEEQSQTPVIISLGRLIKRGFKLEWTKTGASLILPNKRRIDVLVKNNCPYANKEVLKIVKKIRDFDEKARHKEECYVNLLTVAKRRLHSQGELDEHRRQGHVKYSPDCPECKKGVTKQRAHHRAEIKGGGELSVDIGGPYQPGTPITDQINVAKHRYPKYMLVGAFIPFNEKDAKRRYEQEVRDRQAQGLEGPVLMEQFVKPGSQTIYFVEVLPEKIDAPAALRKMINRIENMHKCKAVYRVHADRAQELTGLRPRRMLEELGVMVTTTAGYDSNANGRAERAVRFFQEKARTLLSTNIRSAQFQKKLKTLWPFAVQHAAEVHRREILGLPRCQFEFGQCILSRVNKPESKFDPKLHKVIFLGFAPNVTNGYWVMNKNDKVELTSNITNDPDFDRFDPLMEPTPTEPDQQPEKLHDHPYEDKELEAVMGPEGGGGWYWAEDVNEQLVDEQPDDPMQILSKVQLNKIDENLWKEEDIKREEIPEEIQDEIKLSGAITVSLRDVRQSIGKDRQEWKLALETEIQSLRDTNAIVPVTHVPRGASVLPMKVVLTLKPQQGLTIKKKKARVCVCGNFQNKKPTDLFYTANTDISSIRVALAEAAQHPDWGVSSCDVATAFLNAPMPESEEEAVYVKPPKLLEQFHLIEPNTYWKLAKAVYGLRISPRLWGKERDKQLAAMHFQIRNQQLRAMQSSIDVALWILVDNVDKDFDHKRRTYGYLLTYVDDFLIVAPRHVRKAIEEEISRFWKIRIEGEVVQFDKQNPEASLTFLSTVIRSHPTRGGFTMSQEAFIRDVLKTWEMTDCKPILVPGIPTTVELPVEEVQDPEDVHRAQKIAGSLIWLSTRTRPDITYAQSRISSMMLKAPKTAVAEAIRVLRYLQGTKHYRLAFKSCQNYKDVIAYTDANHATNRSQSGAVIKLGENVVTWRSAKQTEVSRSSAESEVQALSMTAVLAEYITTLRESLCLPTPSVEIRCDNKAAIVLATGEGSWRTKSVANKVHSIREKVERGMLRISFVGTKDQCADSLTKFLKGGPDQNKAREHLSLINNEDSGSERDALARVNGIRTNLRAVGSFGPRLCRVSCSSSDFSVPQRSGSGTFGPFSFVRRKKRLCPGTNLSNQISSAAISARSKHTRCDFDFKFFHRGGARTDYKCSIMVKALSTALKKETTDDENMLPDFEDDSKDAWRLGNFIEIERYISKNVRRQGVHPVDPIAVALKTSPIPIKDLPEDYLSTITDGWYGGKNIVTTLLKDEFEANVEGVLLDVSRWAVLKVPTDNRRHRKAEKYAKADSYHGAATIKASVADAVPSEFPIRNGLNTAKPVIGIRVFHGGPSQAMNEWVYQSYYGYMHCNLAQDGPLHDGVYCWNCIQKAMDSFNDEGESHTMHVKCLGILEGYLHYKDDAKMSLKPRSTKLIAIFAPWDEEIHLPFELGAEDTLAFRLPPYQIGAPIRWFRLLYNVDGIQQTTAAIENTLDSGDWPTPLPPRLRKECAKLAQYNAQKSLNQEDQIAQKALYIKLMETPIGYDKENFALALMNAPFIYNGKLPACMKYIQEGANKDVSPHEGRWRLWYAPKNVPTAKEKYKASQSDSSLKNKLDQSLGEIIHKKPERDEDESSQDDDESSISDKDDEAGQKEEKQEAAGQTGSSTDKPRGRLLPNTTAGVPDSPKTMSKKADYEGRHNLERWKTCSIVTPRQYFYNSRKEEMWDFSEFKEGLSFKVEDYSPILKVQSNGNLTYQDVPAYNSKWLPKDADKKSVAPNKRIKFDPVQAWVEDRWVLTRRLAGDRFCQVIFYYVCDFIWKNNDLDKDERYDRQETLIREVFLKHDTDEWRWDHTKEESTVPVINWYGDTMIYADRKAINKLVTETALLGPLAAFYGRGFQQFLIENKDQNSIRVSTMQKSVDDGRASLNPARIKDLSLRTQRVRSWPSNISHNTSPKAASSSQARTRTRSSSRDRGDHGQDQVPRKKERRHSNSTYAHEEPKPKYAAPQPKKVSHESQYAAPQPKKASHDIRLSDLRYNEEYQRLQRRKEHLEEIERINQAQDRMREQEKEYARSIRKSEDKRQHRDSPRLEERPHRSDRKKDSRSRPYD